MQGAVRRCRAGDRPAIRDLADRLAIGVASWRRPDEVTAAVHDWVDESSVDDFDGAAFVAEDEGGVVGYVSVTATEHFAGERDAYVGELVVADRVEGQGVGSRLLEAAERWAGGNGFRCITLTTGAANDRALEFYRRHGYAAEDVKLTKGAATVRAGRGAPSAG